MFGFGEDEEVRHPALKSFSPTIETVKHVIKSTIKGAAKWALIGGAVMVGLALLPVGAVGVVGGLLNTLTFGASGAIAGALGIGGGTSLLASAGLTGLTTGAIGGAVIGGLKGITSADEAVEVAEERKMMAYNNAAMRARSEAMMSAKYAGMGGVAPGMSPGMARGMGGRDFS